MTNDGRPDGRVDRGDRTATALLDAAKVAFARNGYDGASVRDIAKAADQNPALIRYHFGGKDELYERVIEDALDVLGEMLSKELNTKSEGLGHRVGERLYVFMLDNIDVLRVVVRALIDEEPRLGKSAKKRLKPVLDNAKTMFNVLGDVQRQEVVDVIVSALGAAMLAPLAKRLYIEASGDDSEALGRRQKHVGKLISGMLAQISK